MDRIEGEAVSAHWRHAADDELSVAIANVADYTGAGRDALRQELLRRRLDPSVARDLAHASRLATLKTAVRLERAFAGVSMVVLALGMLLFVAVLNGEPPVDTFETFTIVSAMVGLPFVVWFRQAYANLRLVGLRQTVHEPGWAIGAWFVPVVNLWRPFRMMNELWVKSSMPNEPHATQQTWRAIPALWWIVFVSWRVPDGVAFVMAIPVNQAFVRASQALSLVAGGLALYLIWQISRRQQQLPSSLPVAPLPEEVRSWMEGRV